MGPEPHKPQSGAVGLVVYQNQVRPDVAIAVILPVADQRMIMAANFEWQIIRK
jgi:hypothetical protein